MSYTSHSIDFWEGGGEESNIRLLHDRGNSGILILLIVSMVFTGKGKHPIGIES